MAPDTGVCAPLAVRRDTLALLVHEYVMTSNVRLAVPADAQTLAELCQVVHSLHVERRPNDFLPLEPQALREWFERTLADPVASFWLAELDGAAAGYLLVLRRERPETLFTPAHRWCELDQLSVMPGHRRRGVARALVEAALAHARGAGHEHFEASCWAFNDVAQSAFRRLGFVPKVVRLELP